MLTGIFSSLLIPETKGKSLEELSNEDNSVQAGQGAGRQSWKLGVIRKNKNINPAMHSEEYIKGSY